jgi:SagB-type dehydrogenase family enzyme
MKSSMPHRIASTVMKALMACCCLGGPLPVLLGPARADAPPAAASGSLALPAPRHDGRTSLEAALSQRRSVRAFGSAPLTAAEVGQLLWAAQGESDARGRRTAPSAGASYPLGLMLVARQVDGWAPGVHRYLPAGHRMAPQRAGDAGACVAAVAAGQAWLAAAPAIVVITAQAAATAARYGANADRFVALEAGAAAQNLLLQAVVLGLGGTLVGAFDEAALRRCLPLADGERPVALVALGHAR